MFESPMCRRTRRRRINGRLAQLSTDEKWGHQNQAALRHLRISCRNGAMRMVSAIPYFPALVGALLSLPVEPVPGAITFIAPFPGSAIETWESFSRNDVSGLVNVTLPIFGGQATVSGPNEYIWITATTFSTPGSFGLGPFPA